MDLARIKPTPGAIYQVLVEPDTAAEDVAVELAEYLSTEAIIGTDASAQISFLRETCIEEVVLGLENAGVLVGLTDAAPSVRTLGQGLQGGSNDICDLVASARNLQPFGDISNAQRCHGRDEAGHEGAEPEGEGGGEHQAVACYQWQHWVITVGGVNDQHGKGRRGA